MTGWRVGDRVRCFVGRAETSTKLDGYVSIVRIDEGPSFHVGDEKDTECTMTERVPSECLAAIAWPTVMPTLGRYAP